MSTGRVRPVSGVRTEGEQLDQHKRPYIPGSVACRVAMSGPTRAQIDWFPRLDGRHYAPFMLGRLFGGHDGRLPDHLDD